MNKRGGGRIKIFDQNFSISQCRKTSQWNFSVLCFRIFPVAKNVISSRGGGGLSRFYVESFLSQNAENFCRGTLLRCVSENFR